MTKDTPGISVLITTYNRAPALRETLEALTRVERAGIDCSIVIIDNNSSDNTAEVVKEYGTRLPISYLREPRPGKNCALNKGLRECELKEIVVFTDDDVTPNRNWLHEIVSSVRRWPGIAVFGGRVEIAWPSEKAPQWAEADWIQAFGYSQHDYAKHETLYKSPACPFGPNYWVRRSVFGRVPHFDESIGPRPTSRIMGSETSFLLALHGAGLKMLYCPRAVVQHRVQEKECRIPALRRRGYSFGRGQIRMHGVHRRNIYRKSKILWTIVILADYGYTSLRYFGGCLLRNVKQNCEVTVEAMIRFGQLHESVRQLLKEAR